MSKLIRQRYIEKRAPKTLEEIGLNLGLPILIVSRAVSITEQQNADRIIEEAKPDLLLEPNVAEYPILDFKHYEEMYEEGIKTAKRTLPKIKALLQ